LHQRRREPRKETEANLSTILKTGLQTRPYQNALGQMKYNSNLKGPCRALNSRSHR